ncbi:MAG: sigma 54-interacting transcriptional regulator [Planctomycetota bacterium]
MPRLRTPDQRLLRQLAQLANCNPFSIERMELEQKVLGGRFVADDRIAWSRPFGADDRERPNVERLLELASALVERVRDVDPLSPAEAEDYWDVVSYVLLYRHLTGHGADALSNRTLARVWQPYRQDFQRFSQASALPAPRTESAGHLFACLFQVRRAFLNIYASILGDSRPAVALRRAVWESVFTNDLRRYRRSVFQRLGDIPTLVTGPSGTGKELVARAIGLSQYLPFNESTQRFAGLSTTRFHALNLAAMSPTLIESEMFGHAKGAFTGAIGAREGWFAKCKAYGAVFLDEIGELDPAIQVKLLRVVQQRVFSRLGETEEQRFAGKLIGATNRDLAVELQAGRFREDFYYRLCSDRIHTPSLREQLDDRPEDLEAMVRHISRRLVGEEDEGGFAEQVVAWIGGHLGVDYPWPGNIRELEQCISSFLIRGSYTPHISRVPQHQADHWMAPMLAGALTGDQVLQRYCTWIYYRVGSYEQAARQLGIDRRTVKSKIDRELLDRFAAADRPS